MFKNNLIFLAFNAELGWIGIVSCFFGQPSLTTGGVYLTQNKSCWACNKCLTKSGWCYIGDFYLPLAYSLQIVHGQWEARVGY